MQLMQLIPHAARGNSMGQVESKSGLINLREQFSSVTTVLVSARINLFIISPPSAGARNEARTPGASVASGGWPDLPSVRNSFFDHAKTVKAKYMNCAGTLAKSDPYSALPMTPWTSV